MSDAWKVGKEDKKGILKDQEYCILVGVITKDENEAQVLEYLDELDFLATTAGAITKKVFTQRMPHPNVKTFVGSGTVSYTHLDVYKRQSLHIPQAPLTFKVRLS